MIFQALIDRFKPKSAGPLHNLNIDEQLELRGLCAHPGWATYLKLLDTFIEHNARAMLNTSIDAEVHSFRGLILGLEMGPMLVDNIINKESKEDERDKRQRRLDLERLRRDASLYGTGLWQRSG